MGGWTGGQGGGGGPEEEIKASLDKVKQNKYKLGLKNNQFVNCLPWRQVAFFIWRGCS